MTSHWSKRCNWHKNPSLAVLLCVWYYSEKWGSKTETSQKNYNDEEEVRGEEPSQEGTKRGRKKNEKGGVDWSWKGGKNGWCQCCKGKISVVSPHLTVSWQRCRFRPRRKGVTRELMCCLEYLEMWDIKGTLPPCCLEPRTVFYIRHGGLQDAHCLMLTLPKRYNVFYII